MITLQSLSLRRGPQLLLEQVSLAIYDGQKAGVIGRNGAGKTSLFKLLMGELAPDGGSLQMPEKLRIAHMRQETEGLPRSALDHVIDGDREYRALEAALGQAEAAGDFGKVARLHGEIELIGGYMVRNRAEQLLTGLGFRPEEQERPVRSFSGGWRVRLNLAQALMAPSDLLLLDEPTNHLDLEATLWLQQWLQKYAGTLLLISHDRAFLDEVVQAIVSFEGTRLTLYRGNYSAYEVQKAERLAQQQSLYEKQQRRVEEIESFVRRFRAKATKARQAQSRLKELERMELIAPAHVDSPFRFEFPEPARLPDSLLACRDLAFGYGRPLVERFSINIRPDTRIGLLGANGQGKSTLLKVLVGQLAPLSGEINRHDYLKAGYMAQHQVDELDISASPLQLVLRLDPKAREQEIRNFLGGFDFHGNRVEEPITHFSGGEKSRLALALVAWQRPNLLLLDEPTNHLDLEMRHALTVALQAFAGALIVVSHDRHLLSNTVDEFLLVKGGRVEHFEGDLHDYERMLLESQRAESRAAPSAGPSSSAVDKKQARQDAAARREQLKPLRERLKKLERELEKKQARLTEIGDLMGDQALYEEANKTRLNELLVEQGRLGTDLEALESEWLELSEELERAAEE